MDVTNTLNKFSEATKKKYSDQIRAIWIKYGQIDLKEKVKWQYFAENIDLLKNYKHSGLSGPRFNKDQVLEKLYEKMGDILIQVLNGNIEPKENKALALLQYLKECQKEQLKERQDRDKTLQAYGSGPGIYSPATTKSQLFEFQPHPEQNAQAKLAQFYLKKNEKEE